MCRNLQQHIFNMKNFHLSRAKPAFAFLVTAAFLFWRAFFKLRHGTLSIALEHARKAASMLDDLHYSPLHWVHSYNRVCMHHVQVHLIEGTAGEKCTVQLTCTVRYTISGSKQTDAAVLHN